MEKKDLKNEYSIISHGLQGVFYALLISPETRGGGGGDNAYANIVSLKHLYKKYLYGKNS